MSKNIRTQIGKIVGKTLNDYHQRVKPKIDDLKFKEQYQGRIIDCMVGEVDDNYIETPETDTPVVKLEHSKEGLVKVPFIKGKTILVDADGNETDTPAERCRLVSVGEEEDNKLIILSKNKNLFRIEKTTYTENVSGVNIKFDAENQKIIFNGTATEDVYMYINHRYVYNVGKFIKNEKYQISVITDGSYSLPNDKNEVVYFAFCGGTYSWLRKDGIIINAQNMIATEENPTSWMRIRQRTTFNNFGVKIQVENKQNATRYEPHKYHKTEILLKEPLREGDYIEGKKIYRNVKQDGLTLIPLEEPIIEELPNGITLQGFDNTTMYIENEITPTVQYGYNALIPYKEELLNQKEEVETNTLDIEQNIIPYLMDMEYNLMLMEDN